MKGKAYDYPEVELVPIDDLKPYKRNAKVHPPEQIEMIANSIREFGFNTPVTVDESNMILSGHGRALAARKLEMVEVPCIRRSGLTDEQKRAYILADNKVSELAEWDDKLVDFELLNIESLDMSDFGFESFEDEDEEVEKEKKPKTIESMELKAFEHWDYLVFVFDNQFDWMRVCEEFGIHKVDAGYGDTRKVGVGRVVRGARLLQRLGHQDPDPEQRP